MAFLIFGKDRVLLPWAASRIPHAGPGDAFGKAVAIGVATGPTPTDRLMAVIVYHDHVDLYGTVQISAAACDPRWASRQTLRDVFAVPFIQYRANKMWAAVPHANDRVIRFCKAVGFKTEGTLRHQFGPGSHAVICGMLWSEYCDRYKVDRQARDRYDEEREQGARSA